MNKRNFQEMFMKKICFLVLTLFFSQMKRHPITCNECRNYRYINSLAPQGHKLIIMWAKFWGDYYINNNVVPWK